MSHIYDPGLCDIIRSVARENSIPLREGVYCQLTGPSYESPAEIRAPRRPRRDAVGMSTAVRGHSRQPLRTARLRRELRLSNKAAGLSPTPLSHKEGPGGSPTRAAPLFTRLVKESIKKMA